MKSNTYRHAVTCSSGSLIKNGYGFCACDDGDKAKNIPDGTRTIATVQLLHSGTGGGDHPWAEIMSPGMNDEPILSYDFKFEFGKYEGQWIRKEYPLFERNGFNTHPDYRCLINAASNTYEWDISLTAEEIRHDTGFYNFGPIPVMHDVFVAIEVGLDEGTGYNYVRRVIVPDDPDYIDVMELSGYALPGTGMDGKHQPPPQVCVLA